MVNSCNYIVLSHSPIHTLIAASYHARSLFSFLPNNTLTNEQAELGSNGHSNPSERIFTLHSCIMTRLHLFDEVACIPQHSRVL